MSIRSVSDYAIATVGLMNRFRLVDLTEATAIRSDDKDENISMNSSWDKQLTLSILALDIAVAAMIYFSAISLAMTALIGLVLATTAFPAPAAILWFSALSACVGAGFWLLLRYPHPPFASGDTGT